MTCDVPVLFIPLECATYTTLAKRFLFTLLEGPFITHISWHAGIFPFARLLPRVQEVSFARLSLRGRPTKLCKCLVPGPCPSLVLAKSRLVDCTCILPRRQTLFSQNRGSSSRSPAHSSFGLIPVQSSSKLHWITYLITALCTMNFQNLRYSSANLLLLATSSGVFLLPACHHASPSSCCKDQLTTNFRLSVWNRSWSHRQPISLSLFPSLWVSFVTCAHTLVRAAAPETSLNWPSWPVLPATHLDDSLSHPVGFPFFHASSQTRSLSAMLERSCCVSKQNLILSSRGDPWTSWVMNFKRSSSISEHPFDSLTF